jgi:hypothetical protein
VTWDVDEQTLPLFGYSLEVLKQGGVEHGRVIATYSEVKPHGRSAELTLPEVKNRDSLRVEIKCSDILGNESKKMSLKVDEITTSAVGKVYKPKK